MNAASIARATVPVRIVLIGGNLCVTIPKRLARELGLVQHQAVLWQRAQGRALLCTPLEKEGNHGRTDDASPNEPDPRAQSPTAREYRRRTARRAGG